MGAAFPCGRTPKSARSPSMPSIGRAEGGEAPRGRTPAAATSPENPPATRGGERERRETRARRSKKKKKEEEGDTTPQVALEERRGEARQKEAEGGRGGSSIGGRLAPARAQAGYPTLLPPPQHLRGACSRGGLRLLPTAPAPHSAQCGAHGARHGRRRRRQADR